MFRISSEGLPLLLPHITKQIVCAKPEDFKHLLQYKTIKFADFVDAEFRENASKLLLGCCVVVMNKGFCCHLECSRSQFTRTCIQDSYIHFAGSENASDPPHVDASTIAIGCWRGRTNIAVMVTAIDCQELLERLLMRMENGNGSSSDEHKPSIVEEAVVKENDIPDEDTETAIPEIVG